jgi:N-acetylglucosaminyldiphosphoundecaprenol N-acetyl-beta-D-mannosaminyltransferase
MSGPELPTSTDPSALSALADFGPQGARRVTLAGVRIDPCNMAEAVEAIVARAAAGGPPGYVVTPNAQHLVLLQDDAEFRRIYAGAMLSVADGMPLVWASRWLGTPLPQRVNGTDLFVALCARAADMGLRIFLFGGRPGAADAAAEELRRRFPGLIIAGSCCPPFGFESDPAELARLDQVLREARPDLLFVGLGAPKQERWIAGHAAPLGVPVALGIGVSFEFVGGLVRRAPGWMQRAGLEWFYRLLAEPRRLWRRYTAGNARFLCLVARQWWSHRTGQETGDAARRW